MKAHVFIVSFTPKGAEYPTNHPHCLRICETSNILTPSSVFCDLFVLCRNLATSHVWSTYLLVILFIFKLTEGHLHLL